MIILTCHSYMYICICAYNLIIHTLYIHILYTIHIYIADSILWQETEGAIEWIQSIVNKHTLIPPIYNTTTTTSPLTSSSPMTSSSYATSSHVEVERGIDQHKMFLGMYNTAIEMAKSTS